MAIHEAFEHRGFRCGLIRVGNRWQITLCGFPVRGDLDRRPTIAEAVEAIEARLARAHRDIEAAGEVC